jgi:hypothetical protein
MLSSQGGEVLLDERDQGYLVLAILENQRLKKEVDARLANAVAAIARAHGVELPQGSWNFAIDQADPKQPKLKIVPGSVAPQAGPQGTPLATAVSSAPCKADQNGHAEFADQLQHRPSLS